MTSLNERKIHYGEFEKENVYLRDLLKESLVVLKTNQDSSLDEREGYHGSKMYLRTQTIINKITKKLTTEEPESHD